MRPEARRSFPPGTRFGRYEVLADIAAGGMAMVYLGRALGAAGFQRLVAIKVMHAQFAHDEDFVAMFMDEARLAAQIRHPNVVATLDLENDQDGLYLVMEYVEGDTLVGLLKIVSRAGQRIPQPVVTRIVLDTLNGLHAAHELTDERGQVLNLVHRDVSPHNVLVGTDGVSRITDFGIARAEERLATTRNGQVKGKLAYMAPEQTSGDAIDRRADLWATGVVLWECLAGKRLFAGQSDGEVYRKLLDKPIPRLSEVVADIPSALDDVCAKALMRDPAQRFATAAEFAEALENSAGSMGIASTRVVAQLVREVSGEKLSAMKQRTRESRDSLPSHPDVSGSSSAVRAARRREATSSPPPIPLAATAPSLPPQEPTPGKSSRRGVLLGVAGLIALVGAVTGVWLSQRIGSHAAAASSPAPVAPAATLPPPPMVVPTPDPVVVPVANTPAPAIANDATVARAPETLANAVDHESTGHHHSHGTAVAGTNPPVVAPTTAVAVPTPAPNPVPTPAADPPPHPRNEPYNPDAL
jgi:serine/threonine protein kinase